jgi:phosphotransferase system HPr (HPr) family protein
MEELVTVRNYPGIHAHPAVLFVKRASKFRSEVSVSNGAVTVNGKSIMGVLMLAAETGTVLTIRATGPDEGEAVSALVKLIDSKFEEEA